MGILILSIADIIMKVIILLCAVVAAVSANAIPNTCQLSHNIVKKLATELSSHYPDAKGSPDGTCEDGEGFACAGEIATTIMDCILSVGTDPDGIMKCVQEAWAPDVVPQVGVAVVVAVPGVVPGHLDEVGCGVAVAGHVGEVQLVGEVFVVERDLSVHVSNPAVLAPVGKVQSGVAPHGEAVVLDGDGPGTPVGGH